MVHPTIQIARGKVTKLKDLHGAMRRKLNNLSGVEHHLSSRKKMTLREMMEKHNELDLTGAAKSHDLVLDQLQKKVDDLENTKPDPNNKKAFNAYLEEKKLLEDQIKSQANEIIQTGKEALNTHREIDKFNAEHDALLNPGRIIPRDLISFEKGEVKINENKMRDYLKGAKEQGITPLKLNEIRAELKSQMNEYYKSVGMTRKLSSGLKTRLDRFHYYMANVMPIRYGLGATAVAGLGTYISALLLSSALGGTSKAKDVKNPKLQQDIDQVVGSSNGMLVALQIESNKFIKLKSSKNLVFKNLGTNSEKLSQLIESKKSLSADAVSADDVSKVQSLIKSSAEIMSAIETCKTSCDNAISFAEPKLSSVSDENKKQILQAKLEEIKQFKSSLEAASTSLSQIKA